jgi:hypothetical protein
MLEYPIPLTPRLAEKGRLDTNKESKMMHKIKRSRAVIYRYLVLPIEIRTTRINCVSIENILAIHSMRIYDADADKMLASVAINSNNLSAKNIIITERHT